MEKRINKKTVIIVVSIIFILLGVFSFLKGEKLEEPVKKEKTVKSSTRVEEMEKNKEEPVNKECKWEDMKLNGTVWTHIEDGGIKIVMFFYEKEYGSRQDYIMTATYCPGSYYEDTPSTYDQEFKIDKEKELITLNPKGENPVDLEFKYFEDHIIFDGRKFDRDDMDKYGNKGVDYE